MREICVPHRGAFSYDCDKTIFRQIKNKRQPQMMSTIRATFLGVAVAVGMVAGSAGAAQLSEIRIDWATYNPVSLLLKKEGLLEKEFKNDGIKITWVQSAGSNKALEFLNASSIDFGSTAGAAALIARVNGNPVKSIYVFRGLSGRLWSPVQTARSSL